jgi:aminopeptidase
VDPRVEHLARVLVEYSNEIRPGDRVLIEAEPAAEPLVRACFQEILKAGGHPHLSISLAGQATLTGLDDIFLQYANDDQLDYPATFYNLVYENFESRIRIASLSNTRLLTGVDKARLARRGKAIQSVLENQFTRSQTHEFRWMTTLFPTQAYAQDAEMSLEEFENFVYRACHVDDPASDPIKYWQSVKEEQSRIVEALNGHEQVEVRGPNCDLRLSIKGRKFINACGENNMPDGEVFTGPVEDSVEGHVCFSYPSVTGGNEVEGVELVFKEGKVVEAHAEKNQQFLDSMLETDGGARYLGEFAVGLNYGIDRITKNILFDEKIGGSIHMALGAGYPETGSVNKSAIHWDMITDMRDGGEILVDGELFYKDGNFVF